MTLLQDIQLYAQQLEVMNWKRKAKETTLNDLLIMVCLEFDTTKVNIQGKSRKRWLCVYPRFIFCWIAYYKLKFKTLEIALFLGYEEHSMTVYGRDQWEELLQMHNNYPELYSKEKEHHDSLIKTVYGRL